MWEAKISAGKRCGGSSMKIWEAVDIREAALKSKSGRQWI